MNFLKKVIFKCLMMTVSLCISLGVVMYLLYRRMKIGPKFFEVKPRPIPPTSLTDHEIGTHSYMLLKSQNIKLHYVEKGDRNKPLVLMVHGFYECWYSWRHQIKEFSKDYWVVAVSLRGYGDSEKPGQVSEYTYMKMVEDLRQFILALGKEKCTYLSHDGGAVIGWMLAGKNPELFQRFIVCNGPHPLVYKKFISKSLKQLTKAWYVFFNQMPWIPELFLSANDFEALCKMYYGEKNDTVTFSDEVLEVYKYYFSQKGALTAAINFYRSADFQASPIFTQIKVPTLIIWGTEDIALEKQLAKLSSMECEDVQLKYVSGVGHFVPQEEPVYFNELVREYISITQ